MGVLHTRPSAKSRYRRAGSTAVLVPALIVALSTGIASTAHAIQRTQSTGSQPRPALAATTKPAKPAKQAAVKTSPSKSQSPSKKSLTKPGAAKPLAAAKATKTVGNKKSTHVSRPVSRTTKVQRSRPSPRIATAKRSPKVVAKASRPSLQAVAKTRTLSNDPWQRAIEIERAKAEGCKDPEQSQARRIVLPDLFGAEEEKGEEVLNVATGLLGRPYRFGARGHAFDCSGFVAEVFEQVGVELPHSARDQFGFGDRIMRDELAPGDLVFFRTYRRGASHVGIYMGEDKFIHAASGIGVKISSLNEGYYSARYLGARRVEM